MTVIFITQMRRIESEYKTRLPVSQAYRIRLQWGRISIRETIAVHRRIEIVMRNQRQTILGKLQMDRSLGFVIGSRLWQVVSGPVTILFIVQFLSLDQQGVYYGVFNLLATQAFVELGLINILVSHAGHAAANLDDPHASSELRLSSQRQMSELIRASRRWFTGASILFTGFAMIFGWHLIGNTQFTSPVNWQGPLAVTIPCAALTIYFAPRLAILEGAGFRESIYRYRFWQAVCGSLAVWAALALGLELWCLVAAVAVQVIWNWYVTRIRYGEFFAPFVAITESCAGYSWRRDVVPSQWRMALLVVLMYIATGAFTIIVLWYHQDAAEAGRLGMTLTVTTAIQMLATAWVQTKYPIIANLHAKEQREQAGTLWRQTTLISTGILCLGIVVLVGLVIVLPWMDPRFEGRFISPVQIAMLGVGCVAQHLMAIQSFYVLSRKMPPLLIVVPGFLITAAAVWGGGAVYSTTGIVWGYALAMSLVTLPLHTWGYWLLRRA